MRADFGRADDRKGVVLILPQHPPKEFLSSDSVLPHMLLTFPDYFFSGEGLGEGKPSQIESLSWTLLWPP